MTSHYLNQWWLVYRRIYASLVLNQLKSGIHHWGSPIFKVVHVDMCKCTVMLVFFVCLCFYFSVGARITPTIVRTFWTDKFQVNIIYWFSTITHSASVWRQYVLYNVYFMKFHINKINIVNDDYLHRWKFRGTQLTINHHWFSEQFWAEHKTSRCLVQCYLWNAKQLT